MSGRNPAMLVTGLAGFALGYFPTAAAKAGGGSGDGGGGKGKKLTCSQAVGLAEIATVLGVVMYTLDKPVQAGACIGYAMGVMQGPAGRRSGRGSASPSVARTVPARALVLTWTGRYAPWGRVKGERWHATCAGSGTGAGCEVTP